MNQAAADCDVSRPSVERARSIRKHGIPELVDAVEAGLSEHQAKQSLRVANVPEEDFTEQVESEAPPTITNLAEQGTKKREASVPHYEQQGMTVSASMASRHSTGRRHRAESVGVNITAK